MELVGSYNPLTQFGTTLLSLEWIKLEISNLVRDGSCQVQVNEIIFYELPLTLPTYETFKIKDAKVPKSFFGGYCCTLRVGP